MKRRDFLTRGAAALASPAALPSTTFAQGKYPDRPIRLIVPFPPGGAYDIIARPWAERMKPHLGTIVIENIGGSGGAIGVQTAARAAGDGYTILHAGASTHITEALLKIRPSYDPMKDIAPVSGIAITTFAFIVHSSVPVSDLKEFIAYVKANPGKVSYGTAGHGTLNHLCGELFKLLTGLSDMPHVAYRGAGPSINDVVAGQIPMVVPAMTSQVYELHKAGKIKILAVTHDQRIGAAPDIPTVVEQGFPDLVAQNFIGLFMTSAAPKPIIDQISEANRKLLGDPDYQKLLVSQTFVPQSGLTPEAFRTYVEGQIERWRPVVKRMGIKLE
jgi:tripartite-type tricarboxylate transporter receptor subunit TctC